MAKNNLVSSNSSLYFNSISQETKKKFDALLKNALKNEKVIKKSEDQAKKTDGVKNIHSSSEHALQPQINIMDNAQHPKIKIDKVIVSNESKKDNFILEKFLSDAVNVEHATQNDNDSVTFIKLPVPLPRKVKQKNDDVSSTNSELTYNVSSPKISDAKLLNKLEKLSISSGDTYDIVTKENAEEQKETCSESSGDVVVPIGDILIHNRPTGRNLLKIIQTNDRLGNDLAKRAKKQKSNSFEDTNDNKKAVKSNGLEIDNENGTELLLETKTKRIVAKHKKAKHKSEDIELKVLKHSDTSAEENEINRANERVAGEVSSAEDEAPKESGTNRVAVHIYKTDRLDLNSYIRQPVVKVHIVDSVTGEYVLSDDVNDPCKFVGPSLTRPYNLQAKRSFVPNWNETVVFDANLDHLLNRSNPVVFFFEILDLLPFSEASCRHRLEGANSGWFKIAWAFLKPAGPTKRYTGKKVRLQLYKPRSYARCPANLCNIHHWFSANKRIKYPSTLYVNVTHQRSEPRAKATDEGTARTRCSSPSTSVHRDPTSPVIENKSKLSQTCKVPNVVVAKLKTGMSGSFMMRFSNGGAYLAFEVAQAGEHDIAVYKMADYTEHCTFSGHQALVYDLVWSRDDSYLLSASADFLVCVWNVAGRCDAPEQILPHPSFVYCVGLNPQKLEVVTGCFDTVLRLWGGEDFKSAELTGELDSHHGYITSVCFVDDGATFYSSDNVGVIVEWRFESRWTEKRIFKLRELEHVVINMLIMHPSMSKLVVCCRDSVHRLMDLNVGCVMQWYRGLLNHRKQMTCCISPCGNLLFGPSEDGRVCVWNVHSGALLASFVPFKSDLLLPYCVRYHPTQNLLAISHYGAPVPITVCDYSGSSPSDELQLNDYRDNECKNMDEIMCDTVQSGHSESADLSRIIGKMDVILEMARN